MDELVGLSVRPAELETVTQQTIPVPPLSRFVPGSSEPIRAASAGTKHGRPAWRQGVSESAARGASVALLAADRAVRRECGDGYGPHHFTSICKDPLFPPACDSWAVIVTFPDFFPVTTPVAETVAVLVLELDQTKLW